MPTYNDKLRRFEKADPATYYERQQRKQDADQKTAEFLASGGTIQSVESFIDRQEKERQERIKRWGKTLYDKPVEPESAAKQRV